MRCKRERWYRKNQRALASSLSNLKSAGRRPRKARRRFSNSLGAGLRAMSNCRVPATWISISSPSFRASASTTAAGRRTARLFPHFATCMCISLDIHLYHCISSRIKGQASEKTGWITCCEDNAGGARLVLRLARHVAVGIDAQPAGGREPLLRQEAALVVHLLRALDPVAE